MRLSNSMAETESEVEPDRVTDDVGRKPVPFVSIHPLILSIQQVNLAICYDRLFNDEPGLGGWRNINAAHYQLLARAVDEHSGEGKRFLITFGAAHKYWFLEKLRRRGDIELLDAQSFFVAESE